MAERAWRPRRSTFAAILRSAWPRRFALVICLALLAWWWTGATFGLQRSPRTHVVVLETVCETTRIDARMISDAVAAHIPAKRPEARFTRLPFRTGDDVGRLRRRLREIAELPCDAVVVFLAAPVVPQGESVALVLGVSETGEPASTAPLEDVLGAVSRCPSPNKLLLVSVPAMSASTTQDEAVDLAAAMKSMVASLGEAAPAVLLSHGPGETSQLDPMTGGDLFASAVASSFSPAPDLNGDGLVDVREFVFFASRVVEAQMHELSGGLLRQTPQAVFPSTARPSSSGVLFRAVAGSVESNGQGADGSEDKPSNRPTAANWGSLAQSLPILSPGPQAAESPDATSPASNPAAGASPPADEPYTPDKLAKAVAAAWVARDHVYNDPKLAATAVAAGPTWRLAQRSLLACEDAVRCGGDLAELTSRARRMEALFRFFAGMSSPQETLPRSVAPLADQFALGVEIPTPEPTTLALAEAAARYEGRPATDLAEFRAGLVSRLQFGDVADAVKWVRESEFTAESWRETELLLKLSTNRRLPDALAALAVQTRLRIEQAMCDEAAAPWIRDVLDAADAQASEAELMLAIDAEPASLQAASGRLVAAESALSTAEARAEAIAVAHAVLNRSLLWLVDAWPAAHLSGATVLDGGDVPRYRKVAELAYQLADQLDRSEVSGFAEIESGARDLTAALRGAEEAVQRIVDRAGAQSAARWRASILLQSSALAAADRMQALAAVEAASGASPPRTDVLSDDDLAPTAARRLMRWRRLASLRTLAVAMSSGWEASQVAQRLQELEAVDDETAAAAIDQSLAEEFAQALGTATELKPADLIDLAADPNWRGRLARAERVLLLNGSDLAPLQHRPSSLRAALAWRDLLLLQSRRLAWRPTWADREERAERLRQADVYVAAAATIAPGSRRAAPASVELVAPSGITFDSSGAARFTIRLERLGGKADAIDVEFHYDRAAYEVAPMVDGQSISTGAPLTVHGQATTATWEIPVEMRALGSDSPASPRLTVLARAADHEIGSIESVIAGRSIPIHAIGAPAVGLEIQAAPGAWAVGKDEYVLAPRPNVATDYSFALTTQSRTLGDLTVECHMLSASQAAAIPHGQTIAPSRELATTLAAVPSLGRWEGVPGPTPGEATQLVLAAPPPPGAEAPPPVPVELREYLVFSIGEADAREKTFYKLRASAQRPRRYCEPQVRYDAVRNCLDVDLVALTVDRNSLTASLHLDGSIPEPYLLQTSDSPDYSEAIRIRACWLDPLPNPAAAFLDVDGVPRAFVLRVPGGARPTPPRVWNDYRALQLSALGPLIWATPTDIPVKLAVDGPWASFERGDAVVELGIDADGDRQIDGPPVRTVFVDRGSKATAILSGETLSITAAVSDLYLTVPADRVPNGRFNLLARMTIGDQTTWSAPLSALLDRQGPEVVRVDSPVGLAAVAGSPLTVQISVDAGDGAPVAKVQAALDLTRAGKFTAEAPPAAAKLDADGSWTVELPTTGAPQGVFGVLVQAEDALGNVGDYFVAPARLLSDEAAANEGLGTNTIRGQVIFGKKGAAGAEVSVAVESGEPIQAVADSDGFFELLAVAPGDYKLSAEALVYNKRRTAEVDVSVPPPPQAPRPVTLKVK